MLFRPLEMGQMWEYGSRCPLFRQQPPPQLTNRGTLCASPTRSTTTSTQTLVSTTSVAAYRLVFHTLLTQYNCSGRLAPWKMNHIFFLFFSAYLLSIINSLKMIAAVLLLLFFLSVFPSLTDFPFSISSSVSLYFELELISLLCNSCQANAVNQIDK